MAVMGTGISEDREIVRDRTDLPVLLLHNLDPSWSHRERDEALQAVDALQKGMEDLGHPVAPLPVFDPDLEPLLRNYDPFHYLVLNWCEELPGLNHSDSLVARALETRHYTFTGAPASVLAFSWDKCRVKRLLEGRGIPIPRWAVYDSPDIQEWCIYPAIVKPAYEHCSFGITTESVVLNSKELREQIAYILGTFRQPALVEDFIDGREFHVTAWGNGVLEVLPIAEMDFTAFQDVRDRLCTFESKFCPGSLHYEKIGLHLPASLNQEEQEFLTRMVVETYGAVGCRDYGRLDIRLRDGRFYVLDVNPNPDISPDASMACAAEAAGYSYGAMASRLINLAAMRHPVYGIGEVRALQAPTF